MTRFIVATFLILGWAFYELSGGADFEPKRSAALQSQVVSPDEQTEADSLASAAPDEQVTRVALNLNTLEDVFADRRAARPTAEPIADQVVPLNVDTPQVLPSLLDSTAAQTVLLGASAQDTGDVITLNLQAAPDFREITGTRVNVRSGPGTRWGIVNSMTAGQGVEVLEDNASGWIRIRPTEGGPVGWVADFLISERID